MDLPRETAIADERATSITPQPDKTIESTARSTQDNPTTAATTHLATVSGLIAGPWYYPARYLHRHVTPLRPIWPDYPAAAQNTAGSVTLLLLVNEEGKVDRYRIESAEPPGVFDDAVIRAFTGETYAPGLIAGMPVKGQLQAEVSFEPGQPPRLNLRPGNAPQP
ncbi:hypothetical protein DLREEDagrD3_07720 [Denitratisoma sp. agr-D3]